MVSQPCLLVFAVFGLRSVIAGVVKCTPLVDSRNAVLDCHLPCEAPTFSFLKWTKNQVILALYNGSSYTHMNRFGFRLSWNANSSDISLQINNPTKEDSGEYMYKVLSNCDIFEYSVHLNISDLKITSPGQKEQDNESKTVTENEAEHLRLKTEKSRHSRVLPAVGILTAVLVLGIIVLWKRKKIPFLCTTSETSKPESNLPVESHPIANYTECRVEEGLLQTEQGTDSYVGEIQTNEA